MPIAGAVAVDVEGGLAYVVGDDPLYDADATGSSGGQVVHVLDVSNPASPRFVGEYRSASISSLVETIAFVVAHGPYLALASWNKAELVDIPDPARPKHLRILEADGNTGISCSTAFIDAAALNAGTGDVQVLAAGQEGVRLFDLRDPSSQVPLGLYSTRDWASDVIVADGDTIYVAVGSAGLVDIDASDPATLRPRVAYELPDWSRPSVR